MQAGNASALEMSAGCALQRGNLSVDFGDYNASCANGTVPSKPVARGRGKKTFCTSSFIMKTYGSNDLRDLPGCLSASGGITWSPVEIKGVAL